MRSAAALVVVLCLLWCGPGPEAAEGKAPDYQKTIDALGAASGREAVKDAMDALRKAGTDAFASLIANLGNAKPASPAFFQREVVEPDGKGGQRLHLPTIGEACFDILQGQI
jgi:hypothetical protein